MRVLVGWGLRNIEGMGIKSKMDLEAGRVRVATDMVGIESKVDWEGMREDTMIESKVEREGMRKDVVIQRKVEWEEVSEVD